MHRIVHLKTKKVIVNEVDPKLVISARYRYQCPRMVKLAARSTEYNTVYEFVDNSIFDLYVKVDNMIISQNSSNVSSSGGPIDMRLNDIDPNFERVKGLKRKDNVQKSGGRLKPWHEKIGKRTKVVSRPCITQEISVDPTMQTSMEASSCLDKDEFVNFSSNSQPPPQN
ncbi:hypothetical protein ACSBR2_040184 [Camellia fascicularis]